MADNVSITAGSGTTIAADDVGAGVLVQRVKATWGPDGTANDADIATGKPMPVQVRSATGLIPLGEPTDAANTATNTTSVSAISIWKQISASIQAAASSLAGTLTVATHAVTQSGSWVIAAGTAIIGKVGIDQTTDGTTNLVRLGAETTKVIGTVTINSSQLGSLGQATMTSSAPVAIASDQTGLNNRAFSATVTTLTRPANTTAYTAGDSISNNATAGSVTALSATVSDTNDAPVFVSEILVTSTDTGLAGKRIRAYVYNADPTASTGVGGGDNAAFANKISGYVGSFSGRLEAGFSDGTVGRLVPSFQLSTDTTDLAGAGAGGFVVALPTSGAKTLYVQYQAIDGFTPSANSTTIIGKIKGWQARAS